MRKQRIGLRAEERLRTLLSEHYGRTVYVCAYNSPFDMVVDGYRVELKCAARQKDGHWSFNIHRHGVVSEQTDLYVFRLEQVPYSKKAIHMLFKAPLGTPTVWIGMRGLLNQEFAAAVADFYAFAKGTYVRKEVAA